LIIGECNSGRNKNTAESNLWFFELNNNSFYCTSLQTILMLFYCNGNRGLMHSNEYYYVGNCVFINGFFNRGLAVWLWAGVFVNCSFAYLEKLRFYCREVGSNPVRVRYEGLKLRIFFLIHMIQKDFSLRHHLSHSHIQSQKFFLPALISAQLESRNLTSSK
jgi:hypothetical protein